jgi:predicted permease
MRDLLQDAGHAVRMFSKCATFTFVAVLTAALGIGTSTAVFSVMDAVLFRSLPYGDTSRLVYLYTPNVRFNTPSELWSPTNADFFDLKRQSRSFSDMTVFVQASYSLSLANTVERIGGAQIDSNFFSTLQSRPELGRTIAPDDDQPGHNNVVVISHALWQSMFGGTAGTIGKSLLLDGQAYRIIGVMPPAFQYPHKTDLAYGDASIRNTQVWVPIALSPQQKADRDNSHGYAIARLKAGVSVPEAQAEMTVIMSQLDALHHGYMRGCGAFVKSFDDSTLGPVRHLVYLLLGAALFVLLIACGSVANLLLAKAASRTHELGVRVSLGAARSRIVRQLLTEALVLGLVAGAVGVALAYVLMRALVYLNPGDIPNLKETSLNVPVLLFSFSMTVFTTLLIGILPAWTVSRADLVGFLKTGGNRGSVGARNRARRILVVAQVAFVFVMLAGASLLLRSYLKIQSLKTGFAPSSIVLQVQLDDRYSQQAQRLAFFSNLIERIGRIPGVKRVGAVKDLPLSVFETKVLFWVEGYQNQRDQIVEWNAATPEYFSTMGIPLVEGRFFPDHDHSGDGAAVVVNQAFARKYFAGDDPIGRRVGGGPAGPWSTVVGVVGDVRKSSLEESPAPEIYSSWSLDSDHVYLAIQSVLPLNDVTGTVRATLKAIDPNLAFVDIHTMADLVSRASAQRRFQATLVIAFAAAALLLAMVGFYGLLAYSVKQRTTEIGVRIALGASKTRIVGLVLSEGLRLVSVGLIIGLVGSLVLTRLFSGFLYGVQPIDPLTFFLVPTLLLLVTLAASLIPGWAAAGVSPTAALQSEY